MKHILLGLVCMSFVIISYANKQDSLFMSSKEYQVLNEKIIQLEKDKIELTKEIDKVNNRVSDWYTNLTIGSVIFIFFLGGLLTFQWINARSVARKQAKEEISELRSIIKELEKQSIDIQSKIEEYKQEIEITKSKKS